jgi:hypothetical protein
MCARAPARRRAHGRGPDPLPRRRALRAAAGNCSAPR